MTLPVTPSPPPSRRGKGSLNIASVQVAWIVWALTIAIWVGWSLPAVAAPQAYTLDKAGSQVGFTYQFSGAPTRGTMPVASARMALDFQQLGKSQVEVTLDPSRARAGFVFATQAMKGDSVLATARHPRITFRSNGVSGTLQNAKVTGLLTVRGVTRPVTLKAGLYRTRGSDPSSLDEVTVLLTGTIQRSDFGATGYPDLVADPIELRILARLIKQGS